MSELDCSTAEPQGGGVDAPQLATAWLACSPRGGTRASPSEQDLLAILSSTLRRLYPQASRCEVRVERARAAGNVAKAGMSGGRDCRQGLTIGTDEARLPPASPGPLISASIPLPGEGTGTIVVEGNGAAPPFTGCDAEALEGVASMFALAVQQLRSYEAHASLRLDLGTAKRVQRRLMNRRLPPDAGVRVEVRYLPAFEVGGDFYELTTVGGGRVAGAIGDVSGRGVSAALVMARVSSHLRRALRSGAGPASVLETLDSVLNDFESDNFVTASCFQLDVCQRRLVIANAGHVPAIVRRANGEVYTFARASGLPLGIMPSTYAVEEVELGPSDIILLMTDGLVEALEPPGDAEATELQRIIRSAPHDLETISDRIIVAAQAATAGMPDDTTLVALQLAREV